MGRGRAKAKQQKVARNLKYNTPEMDLDRLQRELTGDSGHADFTGNDDLEDDADLDEWDSDDEWDER